MPRQALTDAFVRTASSRGKDQFEHPDASHPGLILRVTKNGRKTWGFNFNIGGQRARMVLGLYPAMTLREARDQWRNTQNQVSTGKDPREAAAPPQPKTIDSLMRDRLELDLAYRRSRDAVEQRYRKYIQPYIGSIAVEQFRVDPHYNAIIDPLRRAGTLRTAGVVFQDLRALFNFAVGRGVIEFSRIAKVKRPDTTVVRERWLSKAEIATIWHMLSEALRKTPAIQNILKLCLLTGQRLSEVAGCDRSEIDLAAAIWTIPAARSKNGHAHTVPLGPMSLAIFTDAMRQSKGEWLFPNRNGNGPLKHRTVDHTLARALEATEARPLGKLGVKKFTPHDLRRTFATHLSRAENCLAVPHQTLAHLLNHRSYTKASVTQIVYDQNDYLDEKRSAMLKWDDWVKRLVAVGVNNSAPSVPRDH